MKYNFYKIHQIFIISVRLEIVCLFIYKYLLQFVLINGSPKQLLHFQMQN